jgi:hypothetical protein
VLFSYNGNEYAPENPLLTECEASGYTRVVTDYYHVSGPATPVNGTVRFQLRELEDEISYIEDLELFTVDHRPETKVASTADGKLYTYSEVITPLSAVDEDGVDWVDAVRAVDGSYFKAEEPGYLVVSFANKDQGRRGLSLSSPPKAPDDECIFPNEPPSKIASGAGVPLSQVKVEILDENGNWVPYADVPPRHWISQAFVADNGPVSGDVTTLRISWTTQYETDAITQFIAADEQPDVRKWQVTNMIFTGAEGAAKPVIGFGGEEMLTLTKGDMLEFTFETGEIGDPDMKRDYIIRAVGRYEPDYSVYPNLVPDGFRLYDNYPNPFNPTTTIAYELPVAAEVTLEVYNLLGQVVTTLVDQRQDAGHHEVIWDGTNNAGKPVSSGVYLYRISTDGFTQTRKMTLVK